MSKQATPNPEARVGAVSAGNEPKADHSELPKLSLLDIQSPTRADSREDGDAIAHEATVAWRPETKAETGAKDIDLSPPKADQQFVTGMDAHGLTGHSLSFKDGATLTFEDKLPRELKGKDGETTRFQWEGGKLTGLLMDDGTKWQFADGKWLHHDTTGKVDGNADGLRFNNGGAVETIKGPITEASLRKLTDGYLAAPERTASVAHPPADTSMAPETLTAAVETLRKGIRNGDSQAVDVTLRSIPEQNKAQLESLYKQTTERDLRDELRHKGMGGSVALLEPRQEARDAAWLQTNLKSLDSLAGSGAERTLAEHNIRVSLRGMTKEQRQALSKELEQKTGRNLEQTITESKMSAPSKEISLIYAKNGNDLNATQLKQVADIALDSSVDGEQKLFMFKEAFAGNSDAAKEARRLFMGENGEGETRLNKAFSSTDQRRQAEDYAKYGKLDTATFIDMQRTSYGVDPTKGVELALSLMTPQERQQFKQGQHLALSGKTEGGTANETESLRYYERVKKSLVEASGNTSTFFQSTRDRAVIKWEDMAAHGEPTLLGRIASAEGRQAVLKTIKEFTQKDQELMKDPVYRKQVWDSIGGEPGADENSIYTKSKLSGIETEAARKQLTKIFPENLPVEASLQLRHPTLAEASADYIQFDKREPNRGQGPSFTFEALMHAKPEDLAALSGEQRRMLGARIHLIPDGAREIATQMLNRLQDGKDVGAGAPEQVVLAKLKGASPQSIAESITKMPESNRKDPNMEKAAKYAFGDDFERYGRSVLDGKGVSAENLLAMNTDRGVLWNSVDTGNYFKGLKLIPDAERKSILENADKARDNDPVAKAALDRTFKGLTPEQREVALNVLKHPDQEMTVADRIRAKSLGASSLDQQKLIDDFAKLPPQSRLDAINEYAKAYKRFLPEDLSKSADENQKRQIELSLPMSRGDLERAFRDSVKENGQGLYGYKALGEISIGEAQNQFQSQLLEKLPPEKRQELGKQIEESFQKYVKALKENSDAKDQYAKDLSDKIMFVAGFAAGSLPVGTTMVRLAFTAATSVAARAGTEHLIKGGLNQSDLTHAAILGTVDAATLARGSAFKGLFEKSVTSALEKRGLNGTESVVRSVSSDFEQYLKRGEKDAPIFQAELTNRLKRQGVADPEVASQEIMQSFRQQALPERLRLGYAELPGSKEAVTEMLTLGQKSALNSAVERGLIDENQAIAINKVAMNLITNFAERPATREHSLQTIKWINENLRFITRGAASPEQARAYTDIFVMAAAHPHMSFPMEALRGADTTMLKFYREQMSGVAGKFRPPTGDAAGGARYEYAMQSEIMDAIAKSNNPEMKNWVFIPGGKGSTADHAGLDGALINIKDGRIMPIDLKNYNIGDQVRWATHIPGRTPDVNFNHRSTYNDQTGRLAVGARPSSEAVEEHLLRIIKEKPHWTIKPGTFSDLNPESTIRFPSLSDGPAETDAAGLRNQAARMRDFIRQADANKGDSNLALLRQRLESPQNGSGGLRFVEREIAKLEAAGVKPAAAKVSEIDRLRTVDGTVTEAEAKRIAALREKFESTGTGADLPGDRELITTQRAFDRLGVRPDAADLAALLKAKTPEDIERVAKESIVRNLTKVLQDITIRGKAADNQLVEWSSLFFNRQTGEIDRGMLTEIAKDKYESQNLRELLRLFYKKQPATDKARKEFVDTAIDRLATL